MKKKKRTSKKTNVRTKALIRKKKAAYHKKAKKTAKQMMALGIAPRNQSHKQRQMAVPNLCPFKSDLLRRALKNRQELKKELESKRTLKKNRKQNLKKALDNCRRDMDRGLIVPKSLQSTSWSDAPNIRLPKNKWEHKHMYFKELNQVISNSDVIIEVLDARDPLGCRSLEIERRIISSRANILNCNKKLILLINKIDLIPSDILSKWMRLLRREHAVIAFKASTQSQKRKLHSNLKFNRITSDNTNMNRCVGGNVLLQLIEQYSISSNLKVPMTVGFIGYPNTGKSSVINSLKRSQCVGTASMPGFTKNLQVVKLNSHIKLIDSPGVIFSTKNDVGSETRLVLRNALKLQDIDAIETVAHILSVSNHGSLCDIYSMKNNKKYADVTAFLCDLAFKLNHLKSGGTPDIERAAKLCVNDWNHGKIPFYVAPPSDATIELDTETKFVESGEFAKEFDINALLDANHETAVIVSGNGGSNKRKYLELNANYIIDTKVDDNHNNQSLSEFVDDQDESDEHDLVMNDYQNDPDITQTDAFKTA